MSSDASLCYVDYCMITNQNMNEGIDGDRGKML